jgi:hypothetical protein
MRPLTPWHACPEKAMSYEKFVHRTVEVDIEMAAPLDTILHERQENYGKLLGQGHLTQRLKDVLREHPHWYMLDGDMKEALDMIMHKAARIVNGNPKYIDSWVDIGGYAKCVQDRLEEDKKRVETVKQETEPVGTIREYDPRAGIAGQTSDTHLYGRSYRRGE